MDNITGFIVEVKAISDSPVEYVYDNEKKVLIATDNFIGYFWQMTGSNNNGDWSKAHVRKITLIDNQKLKFQYEKEAVFDISKVKITIKAKRGPESNNKYLSGEFDKYETWNPV